MCRVVAILFGAMALCQAARAGVLYSFSETLFGSAWSFSAPSLLTVDDTVVQAAQLFGVTQPSQGTAAGKTLYLVEIELPNGPVSAVAESFTPGQGIAFEFFTPINHFGTYSSEGATLTISDTPEPSTYTLFLSALIAFVGWRSRLRHTANS
jgi:hypothetical protein